MDQKMTVLLCVLRVSVVKAKNIPVFPRVSVVKARHYWPPAPCVAFMLELKKTPVLPRVLRVSVVKARRHGPPCLRGCQPACFKPRPGRSKRNNHPPSFFPFITTGSDGTAADSSVAGRIGSISASASRVAVSLQVY